MDGLDRPGRQPQHEWIDGSAAFDRPVPKPVHGRNTCR